MLTVQETFAGRARGVRFQKKYHCDLYWEARFRWFHRNHMLKSVLTNTTVLFSWLRDNNEKPYRRDEERVPKMGARVTIL